jgi:hypothetical protein
MDDASVGFDSELHLARDRELYVLREQIRFHEARRAIVDYLGQARATIHGLRPEQAAALVKKLGDAKELGDNALAKLANYDSRLHSYMEAYEEYNAQQPRSPLAFNRLHGGIRTRDEALAMPPPPEYAEGVNSVALDDLKLHGRVPLPPTPIPDPIILELAQKVSDNHEAEPLAALMNAYQSASGLAPPPALSITGFLDIRPGETSFEYYNARVTPNFHRLIVGTGQMFIDRNGVDQAVKLVTLVAPQVLPSMRNGANGRVIRTGYPMTAEGKGPDRQDIVRFGDGRGVVVGNAIYAISQRSPGDAVQLKAVAARLGVVRRKEDRPPDVKDDVLQNVMNSLLQRWRVVVGGGATLTEAFRSRMTAAGDYYSNFTGMNYNPKDNPAKIGLFAYETEPSWAGGLAGSLLPTNHPSANDHLIGADYEPFARLIDVLARPEFSPVSDAVVEEQAWMRAHTVRVAVNALYDTAHVLSTDDDMVFPQDLAKFFIRPLALKLASLVQDHPSRIMRQLEDSDTLGVAGGEVLTKWLALLHDPNKIPEHIESKPITRENLAELDLIAPPSSERPAGGPLWPIFQQLLFGDGQHAPTNNDDWDAQATLYYLQGDNMASRVKNDNLDTMGRENLAYFMGAYSGLMSLLSKLKMEKEELSRYEWRAAFGVMRQLGTPALVTTYAPKQLPFLGIAGSLFNKVFVPFDVFGSIWSSYMLEQITSDAVKEAWLTSATLSHFDFLIGHFGMPDIEDGMSRYGFRKQSLFNNTTGSKLHGMRQQVEMMFGSGAEYGRQTMGFGYRSH